jgi:hypothetical protein
MELDKKCVHSWVSEGFVQKRVRTGIMEISEYDYLVLYCEKCGEVKTQRLIKE